jgi:hypothetical protein
LDVETATAWVNFLRDAGGWGIAVVEAFVLVFLWRRYEAKLDAKDARLFALLDRTNDILGLIQGRPAPRTPMLPTPVVGDGDKDS